MHAERLIPSGFEGKFCKIKIQNSEGRYPFTYYGVALREDEENIYIQMGRNEIFFRKQHISSIEFPKHSEGELSKPDTVQINREGKVVYRIGGKTQARLGKISESENCIFVLLDNKEKRMVPKDCVLKISYPGDESKSGKKKDWTNNIHTKRKENSFSYSKWWSREHVEEVE